jgi:hypothetical protein
MQLVPYTGSGAFSDITEYSRPLSTPVVTCPGEARGIYITLHPEAVDEAAATFQQWFARRSEVRIVDIGTSDKARLGFILMEWVECDVDQLFLDILDSTQVIADYTLYGRILEG